MFIFTRCFQTLAPVTPSKYNCCSKDVTYASASIFANREFNEQSFSTPTLEQMGSHDWERNRSWRDGKIIVIPFVSLVNLGIADSNLVVME